MRRMQGVKRGGCVVGSVIALLFVAGVSFAEDEAEGWTGELAVAITAQSGTVDTFAGSIDAETERVWDEVDLVRFRFTGVYGVSRDGSDNPSSKSTIQDSQGFFATWRHAIGDRFFWDSGSELSRDSTQDRRIRVAVNSGPGYRLWRGEEQAKRHFDVIGGLGYRYEVFDGNSNDPGSDTDFGNFADIVAGYEFKNLFFEDRVELTHTATGRVPGNQPSSYLLEAEVIVGVPLSEAWSFRTSFVVEYIAEPGDGVLNKTTTRTSIGLGYKF